MKKPELVSKHNITNFITLKKNTRYQLQVIIIHNPHWFIWIIKQLYKLIKNLKQKQCTNISNKIWLFKMNNIGVTISTLSHTF